MDQEQEIQIIKKGLPSQIYLDAVLDYSITFKGEKIFVEISNSFYIDSKGGASLFVDIPFNNIDLDDSRNEGKTDPDRAIPSNLGCLKDVKNIIDLYISHKFTVLEFDALNIRIQVGRTPEDIYLSNGYQFYTY